MKNKIQPKIKYFDLYGLRKEKGKFLESHDVKNTKWQELELKEPNFWFVPKNPKGIKKYDKFISLKSIFVENGSGVITRRDNFVVSTNIEELKNRIQIFINKNLPKEFIEKGLAVQDTYEWLLEEARNKVAKDDDLDKKYFEYLYRPFDKRWIIYHESLISRPSALLRKSFSNRKNIGLICSRRTPTGADFNHIFISNILTDIHSAADQSYIFPLYLYSTDVYAPKNKKEKYSYGNLMLFDKPKEKEPNIKAEIIQKLSETYKRKITPEEIFYYIYAILYSGIYRKKYNEFLKIDFPKIPFTKDNVLFYKISGIGKELVDLHLLKSEKLENNKSIKFPAVGNNKAEKREYKDNKIHINDKQYFVGIAPEVWNYHIGGYQVLDKWLKDRTDKILSAEDVNHFLKVITALNLTVNLQKEIDKLYPEVEKNLI